MDNNIEQVRLRLFVQMEINAGIFMDNYIDMMGPLILGMDFKVGILMVNYIELMVLLSFFLAVIEYGI